MKVLIHELQHERSFEYEGLTMLPKDNEYTTHEIKLKMKQFNDPDDDKIVLDRTEFMKFWSKEFEDQIKNAPLGGTMMELHHLMDILKRREIQKCDKINDGKINEKKYFCFCINRS